jgi:hypothetical protein
LAFVPDSLNNHPVGSTLDVPVPPSVLKSCVYVVPIAVRLIDPLFAISIVIEYADPPVHACESVAVTVKFDVPVVVGVPARTPPVERRSPAGNVPLVTAKV